MSAHFIDPAYDIPGFIYAVVVFNGGVLGFLKRKSLPSLLAGGISGILAGYGAYRVTQDPKDVFLSLGVSSILTLIMGLRFSKTGKFMPAGMVTIISLIMAVRYAIRLQ